MKHTHITIGSLLLSSMDAVFIANTTGLWQVGFAILLLGTYVLAHVSLTQEVSE
jgi:hypothetical protein